MVRRGKRKLRRGRRWRLQWCGWGVGPGMKPQDLSYTGECVQVPGTGVSSAMSLPWTSGPSGSVPVTQNVLYPNTCGQGFRVRV